MVAYLLLGDCSNMGVGVIRRQEEDRPGSRCASDTAAMRADLAVAKAADMFGSHVSTLGLPARAAVSGCRIRATPLRKRW